MNSKGTETVEEAAKNYSEIYTPHPTKISGKPDLKGFIERAFRAGGVWQKNLSGSCDIEKLKEAIFQELKNTNHLGNKNENYYYITGVIISALNKIKTK